MTLIDPGVGPTERGAGEGLGRGCGVDAPCAFLRAAGCALSFQTRYVYV